MKGMLGTGRALWLPCCFGRGMSLVPVCGTLPGADPAPGLLEFFLAVSAALCPPLALRSLPGVFGSDYTYKEDGDGLTCRVVIPP